MCQVTWSTAAEKYKAYSGYLNLNRLVNRGSEHTAVGRKPLKEATKLHWSFVQTVKPTYVYIFLTILHSSLMVDGCTQGLGL